MHFDFTKIEQNGVFTESFKKAVTKLLPLEGGYVNNPNDPGGETKFGITKQSYEDLIIANLTIEDAAEIYYKDFWNKIRAQELDSIGGAVFDMAVNAGPEIAVKILQRILGATDDGIIGPKTIAAYNGSRDAGYIKMEYALERLRYYKDITRANKNLREFNWIWLDRVFHWVD